METQGILGTFLIVNNPVGSIRKHVIEYYDAIYYMSQPPHATLCYVSLPCSYSVVRLRASDSQEPLHTCTPVPRGSRCGCSTAVSCGARVMLPERLASRARLRCSSQATDTRARLRCSSQATDRRP
eukprot:COSAG01_NODE_3464_length_6063_cov_22.453219_6_plen_126_part_00